MSTNPDVLRRCENCTFLHTFKSRPDEDERYGFDGTGYGCKKAGYEGYTTPVSFCSFHHLRQPEKGSTDAE